MVFPQLIFSGLVRKYFTNAFPYSPKQFYYPYVILNSITILFGILLNIYWWKYPPPAVGTVIFGENGEVYKSKEEMDLEKSKSEVFSDLQKTQELNKEVKEEFKEYLKKRQKEKTE